MVNCKTCGIVARCTERKELCVNCLGKIRLAKNREKVRKHRAKNPTSPDVQAAYYDRWYQKMMDDPVKHRDYRDSRNDYHKRKKG